MESKQCLPAHARRVLNILSLVENHILPLDTLEVLLILGDELVAGNQDTRRTVFAVTDLFLAPELSECRSAFDITRSSRFGTKRVGSDCQLWSVDKGADRLQVATFRTTRPHARSSRDSSLNREVTFREIAAR